jgi:1-deoxy-D-xylulose-5-phosphate synthase
VKGKGFAPAEKEQTKWHAQSSPFDKITGQSFAKKTDKPQPPKYQDVFGHTLVELAKANNKIVGITPAMPSGCSMNIMMKEIPERAFDVGICEQHAVTLSAGLATQGMIPFCNIYSSFMQRAYDQVIHDVAIQELPVIFCLDRAGVVGADGPTHHGCYDIAYFRCIPNMIIASPMNEQELRNLMYTATLNEKDAFVIRYPRGEGVMIDWKTPFEKIQIGKGRTIQEGEEIAVLTIGHIGNYVTTIQPELQENNIYIGHYDMRFVKPIDEELMHHICQKYDKIITIEDGSLMGGFGSAVLEFIADNRYKNTVKRLGIPDKIIEHGTQLELHKEMGFAPEQILETIKTMKLVEIIS